MLRERHVQIRAEIQIFCKKVFMRRRLHLLEAEGRTITVLLQENQSAFMFREQALPALGDQRLRLSSAGLITMEHVCVKASFFAIATIHFA